MHIVKVPTPSNKEIALLRAEKIHAGIVTDTVNLEGNPFTLPQVQTLLDGVTVGGHKIDDAEQVRNQSDSWKVLVAKIREEAFSVNKEMACSLYNLVSKNEAMTWGEFRNGQVSIAGTAWKPPHWETLDAQFDALIDRLSTISDVFIRAMTLYLDMARNQYFWDGNKRTGRLMMNGILLNAGHDVISVPFKRQLEFNEKMLTFYDTGKERPMFEFLLSCSTTPDEKPTLSDKQ